MFNKLFEWGYCRNFKEAVGFYLFYSIFSGLLSVSLGLVVALLMPNASPSSIALKVSPPTVSIISISLSFAVLKEKNLLDNFGYVALGILSGVLSFVGGFLLGLIPVAFLTTREENLEK